MTPMGTKEAEEIVRAANPWHYRCLFLGLHKKVDYFWPNERRPISLRTVCLRCGDLLDIKTL